MARAFYSEAKQFGKDELCPSDIALYIYLLAILVKQLVGNQTIKVGEAQGSKQGLAEEGRLVKCLLNLAVDCLVLFCLIWAFGSSVVV